MKDKSENKLWFTLKALEVRLRFILLLVLTGFVIGYWDYVENYWDYLLRATGIAVKETVQDESKEYFCPMHTFVVQKHPGKCPICGMTLSERAVSSGETESSHLQISPELIKQAGVAVATVEYRSLISELSLFGKVESDLAKTTKVVARFGGRIEKLNVNSAGEEVTANSVLATFYSPEAQTAAQEYIGALGLGVESPLVQAAARRLLYLGFTKAQISELQKSKKVNDYFSFYAPAAGAITEKFVFPGEEVEAGKELFVISDLSKVWAIGYLPESKLSLLSVGQKAIVKSAAFPAEEFIGSVDLVAATVEGESKLVRIRVPLDNVAGKLKPGMTLQMFIQSNVSTAPMPRTQVAEQSSVYYCPMDADVISDKPGDCPKCGMHLEKREGVSASTAGTLSVPEAAVIDSGNKKIVYVRKSEGLFESREVSLGLRAGEFYPVISGLSAGEQVVARGAFLIDAETRLFGVKH